MIGRALPTAGACAVAACAATAPAPAAAQTADCGPFAFEEAADAAGLRFTHRNGASAARHLAETMGAGVAWLDYDGDGWQDLYLVQSGPLPPDGTGGNALYRNLGGGRFEEVEGSGAEDAGYGQGATAVDVDGDGATDLVVTNFDPDPGADGGGDPHGVALYRNLGDGRFEEATAAAGLERGGWLSSAALADAEGDGDLDLYLSRYVDYRIDEEIFCGDPETGERRYCDPSIFSGAGDLYFRNLGGGRFEEATAAAGIAPADGRGLGVLFTDLDGDRFPDLYVANDLTINFLFLNRGDGSFEDLSLLSGTAVNRDGRPEAGMGVAAADVDGDLDADLAVTNFDVETNTLYRNLDGRTFVDVSGPDGFGLPSFNRLAFGIVAADLDHDADVDYYVANGHIFQRPLRQNVAYRQPDQLLAGDGRGRFTEVACAVLAARPTVARGLAAGDADQDGDLDLVVQENGGPVRFLRNGRGGGEWLALDLRGRGGNRHAVGARALLTAGERTQVRWVTAGDSYQSSSDRRLHFGTGGGEPRAVDVDWPSGRRTRLLGPPAGRYLVLFEP